MLKTVLLVLAGFSAGLLVAFWLQPGSGPSVEPRTASRAVAVARPEANGRLPEARLGVSLEASTFGKGSVRASLARDNASNRLDPGLEPFIDREQRAANAQQRRLAIDLIVAGFAPDRADWLSRRTQELRRKAMRAQAEAERAGRPPPADVEAVTLRTELGEEDYERFLTAQGLPTAINIVRVIARSPAQRAGLQPGDQIFSYDGKRVFNVQELNELALRGTSGEPVVVYVSRNRQNFRVVLPRGPIGVLGGNDRRGPLRGFQR